MKWLERAGDWIALVTTALEAYGESPGGRQDGERCVMGERAFRRSRQQEMRKLERDVEKAVARNLAQLTAEVPPERRRELLDELLERVESASQEPPEPLIPDSLGDALQQHVHELDEHSRLWETLRSREAASVSHPEPEAKPDAKSG